METGTRITVNGNVGTVTQTMVVSSRRKLQTLVNVAFDNGMGGTFDESQCEGWGCADGCPDCQPARYTLLTIPGVELGACAACHGSHPIQQCPSVRAELMKEAS
jgi:hypothetical protein